MAFIQIAIRVKREVFITSDPRGIDVYHTTKRSKNLSATSERDPKRTLPKALSECENFQSTCGLVLLDLTLSVYTLYHNAWPGKITSNSIKTNYLNYYYHYSKMCRLYSKMSPVRRKVREYQDNVFLYYKILERILNCRFINYLEKYKLLQASQYGFHSKVTHDLTDFVRIFKNIKNVVTNERIHGLFLD